MIKNLCLLIINNDALNKMIKCRDGFEIQQKFPQNSNSFSKFEILTEIQKLRPNPKFSPKFEIFRNIFYRNSKYSINFEIFTEIQIFH